MYYAVHIYIHNQTRQCSQCIKESGVEAIDKTNQNLLMSGASPCASPLLIPDAEASRHLSLPTSMMSKYIRIALDVIHH